MIDVKEVFEDIYSNNKWGGVSGEGYSGDGSHDPNIVIPYVNSVRWFASKLGGKLNAVDFGCGDFNVGGEY